MPFDISQKSLDSHAVWKLVRKVYEPFQATQWLFSGHPHFAGKSPIMMIKAGRSAEVKAVVEQLNEGLA